MTKWPKHPTIYEINTWVWLNDLSQTYDRPLTLANVPAEVWDGLADIGFDVVWLMGVWERGPRGQQIARDHPDLQAEYHHALADFTPDDVVGSPYSVHRYVVDERLGGPAGLAAARTELAQRSIRLLLDYVPNHVAPDHPWVTAHPEYFIQGTYEDLRRQPDYFFEANDTVFAFGRDPYFPAWTDTAQLNLFNSELREAVTETLIDIGSQCDGVRVDMAMLAVKRIFAGTWGDRAGIAPGQEFWWAIIENVRQTHPDMHFIAEAYWDMEWELQQQGFDHCYDKRLYDRLAHGGPTSIKKHLTANLNYQSRLVRFIENHDEPRAAATFLARQTRAAAIVSSCLPGARLFHEGQFEGRTLKLPVQLGRRQAEPGNAALQTFYRKLLHELKAPVFHANGWRLCAITGWADNVSTPNLIAFCWQDDDQRRLIVVNLSASPAQGHVQIPWENLTDGQWRLADPFSGDSFLRQGSALRNQGLFVDLNAFNYHFFHVGPA